MKLKLFALACASSLAFISGAASAQAAPYAKVELVNGSVSVSSASQTASVTSGMALAQGSQVMVGAASVATIAFSNGCRVTLQAGESMEVSEAACSALVAQRAGTPVVSGGPGLAPMAVLTTVVAAAILYDITRDSSISGK